MRSSRCPVRGLVSRPRRDRQPWLMPSGPPPRLRYVPTRANGQLALGVYRRESQAGRYLLICLDVLATEHEHASDVIAFRSRQAFARFGLRRSFRSTSHPVPAPADGHPPRGSGAAPDARQPPRGRTRARASRGTAPLMASNRRRDRSSEGNRSQARAALRRRATAYRGRSCALSRFIPEQGERRVECPGLEEPERELALEA
jgi:hypothetical protein